MKLSRYLLVGMANLLEFEVTRNSTLQLIVLLLFFLAGLYFVYRNITRTEEYVSEPELRRGIVNKLQYVRDPERGYHITIYEVILTSGIKDYVGVRGKHREILTSEYIQYYVDLDDVVYFVEIHYKARKSDGSYNVDIEEREFLYMHDITNFGYDKPDDF